VVDVFGWPLCLHHATILFGDSMTLKSYLALAAAGCIVQQTGRKVAVMDWELEGPDHRDRLYSIFGRPVPEVWYVHPRVALAHGVEGLRQQFGRRGIEYGVFDSVGYATPMGNPAEASEALGYFSALNRFDMLSGHLHVAHVTKEVAKDGEVLRLARQHRLRPFGSNFWHTSGRNNWFVARAAEEGDDGSVTLGLYHQKVTVGKFRPSVGLRALISDEATSITPCDLAEVADLSVALSAPQRFEQELKYGSKPEWEVQEALSDLSGQTFRQVKSRLLRKGRVIEVPGRGGVAHLALVAHGSER
jgi:hypothetical protein